MGTSIPGCAVNRPAGTVIVRLKMDEHCCDPDQDTRLLRYMTCELCNRTRVLSKSSDCDSGLVGKSRTNRTRTARNRYVNVCAAVCLLLLVGGLSPQSTAAPHWTRKMDTRQRRSPQENSIWGNPCDYRDLSGPASKYTPKQAKMVAFQARRALTSPVAYKDTFALKVHSCKSFDTLLEHWSGTEWLRQFPWFKDEVLPKEKVLTERMPDEYVKGLMANIDDILPAMYKGLKMIVAGFHKMKCELELNDDDLKNQLEMTMNECRAVLCYFSELLMSRNLKSLPLLDDEVPDLKGGVIVSALIFRDTMNYLEYIDQVFQTMYESEGLLPAFKVCVGN